MINSKFEVSDRQKTVEQQRDDIQKVYNFCKHYFKQYHKFPKLIKISNATELNNEQIKLILKFLISKNYLKIYGNNYYFPEQKISRKKKIIKKEESKKEIKKIHITFDRFIEIIQTIFTGIISTIGNLFTVITGVFLSTYFTYIWFIDYFDGLIPIILSMFIVFGSLISYQNYKKQNKKRYFVFWIIIISFSIVTGISGQLNKGIEKKIILEETNVNANNKTLLFNDYSNRIKDIKIEIESVRKEREKLQEFLSNTSFDNTDDKKEYKDINYRIYLKNNDLNKLRDELTKLEKEKENLLKEDVKLNITEKIDFFTWLNSFTNINADWFKLLLYTLLAIFADILPPVNLSNLLVYYKRKIK